jgi:hypothetical protein
MQISKLIPKSASVGFGCDLYSDGSSIGYSLEFKSLANEAPEQLRAEIDALAASVGFATKYSERNHSSKRKFASSIGSRIVNCNNKFGSGAIILQWNADFIKLKHQSSDIAADIEEDIAPVELSDLKWDNSKKYYCIVTADHIFSRTMNLDCFPNNPFNAPSWLKYCGGEDLYCDLAVISVDIQENDAKALNSFDMPFFDCQKKQVQIDGKITKILPSFKFNTTESNGDLTDYLYWNNLVARKVYFAGSLNKSIGILKGIKIVNNLLHIVCEIYCQHGDSGGLLFTEVGKVENKEFVAIGVLGQIIVDMKELDQTFSNTCYFTPLSWLKEGFFTLPC